MQERIQKLLPAVATALVVLLAAKALTLRIDLYAAQLFIGSNRADPRGLLPLMAVLAFAALLAAARTQAHRQVTFLILLASFAVVVAGSRAVNSFLILPAEVGQPPWQPASTINLAAVVLWTLVLWLMVGLFAWRRQNAMFTLALGIAAVELVVIPFLQPIWGELR